MKKFKKAIITVAIAAAIIFICAVAGKILPVIEDSARTTLVLAGWTLGMAAFTMILINLIRKGLQKNAEVLAAEISEARFTADEVTAVITVAFRSGVREFRYMNRRIDSKFPTPFITKEGKKLIFELDDPRDHLKSLKGSLKKCPRIVVMAEFTNFFRDTLKPLTA